MEVNKKDLEKSQVELTVTLSYEEFKSYIEEGVKELSKEVSVEGFRPGKAPYEVLKQKVGEMSILDKAARIAVNKTIDKAINDNLKKQAIGQPRVDITQLAAENPLQYKVVIATIPEVKLGDYKNAKVKPEKAEEAEKSMEQTLKNLQESQGKEEVAEREVREGDKVIVDIDMFLNDVPVEGGQSKDTPVIIGKDYLVPGFDKKLLGAKKGDVRQFKLPYPIEHHQTNLAGKAVDINVKIKQVYKREIPEINVEFASNLGVKNVEELNKVLKEDI